MPNSSVFAAVAILATTPVLAEAQQGSPPPSLTLDDSATRGSTASPVVQQDEKYYDVSGTTEKELQAAIKRLGPQGRYAGYTEWRVTWAFQGASEAGQCSVATVATKVDITVTLPLWTNASEAADDVRLAWNLSMRDLRRHEQMHVDNAVATARAIENAVRKLPPTADCHTLEVEISRTANAVLEEGRRKDSSYDTRTVHGIADRSLR